MAPSLVLRKWHRTRTPAWRWLPAASHKKGQLAHSDTGILRHVLFSITKRRINILTAANVMSISLVHDQIRTGVRSDVAVGCCSDSTADLARPERTGRVHERNSRGLWVV